MALFSRQHAGHSMGDMDMGSSGGMPGYFYMQQMFWAVIGSVIGFATILNILNHILYWHRSRSANAKPQSVFWVSYATITAMTREISNASLGSWQIKSLRIRSPPLGKVIVVLSYFITVLVLCFYKYNTFDQWSWEDIAYRAGCIGLAQVPLVFLLAGKQNVIGYLIGSSYEQLNWLHRWVSRILWITITIHMSFWFRSWVRYDYIKVKLATDQMTQTGFAAWCILTAIVLTSFAPIRRWNYEIFVVQHLVLFAGLIGTIMIHVDNGKIYIWIAVGLYFLDRVIRFLVTLIANLSIFRRTRSSLWGYKASLTPLPGNITKISIESPNISWKPGQHMFLSCHSVVPLQSHPFTAASLPSDGKLEFLIQAHKGGTKRFHAFTSKHIALPKTEDEPFTLTKHVGIEGPYGTIRPLQQFDSVVFFAGSTGATFTVPLMRDTVKRWMQCASDQREIATKKVRFVWVVKSRDRIVWFREQLEQALIDVARLQEEQPMSELELDMSIYITCDEELESSNQQPVNCPPTTRGEAEFVTTEKEYTTDKFQSVKEIELKSTSSEEVENDGCGPEGTCCCKAAVDEDDITPVTCCCKPTSSSTASSTNEKSKPSSTSEQDLEKEKTRPKPKILSGRPKPRAIIRKVLEEAIGESAVVVCGPQGLQDDVRHSVVALSDERAVHKGTGAQGIYLHIEGFCY